MPDLTPPLRPAALEQAEDSVTIEDTTAVGETTETSAQALRVVALQQASFLSKQETPLDEFLSKAAAIENYLVTGNTPTVEQEK